MICSGAGSAVDEVRKGDFQVRPNYFVIVSRNFVTLTYWKNLLRIFTFPPNACGASASVARQCGIDIINLKHVILLLLSNFPSLGYPYFTLI